MRGGETMKTRQAQQRFYNRLLDAAEEVLDGCGSCSHYHFPWFERDCREDRNRFGSPEQLVAMWKAAPDLLEACKAALESAETLDKGPHKQFDYGAGESLRRAIAKAEAE
jgi:hypothetical protein